MMSVAIPDLDRVIALAAGSFHSLALGADGTVWAWGLWQGTQGAGQKVPVKVAGLDSMIAVAAGHEFSMALRVDGTVWSWGANQQGQLGDGTTTPKPKKIVQVQGLKNIVAIASGLSHGLALDVGGIIWTWGLNNAGQLGDGSITSRSTPAPVVNLDRVIAIAGGDAHSLAVRADGTVWAWGWNVNGQLGDGTTQQHGLPVQVPNLTNIVAIATGGNHSLALKADSTVLAWGNNDKGQLGNNTTADSHSPTPVLAEPGSTQPLDAVVAIAAGAAHSLAIQYDGEALAWGFNNSSRLCDGTDIDRHSPIHLICIATGA